MGTPTQLKKYAKKFTIDYQFVEQMKNHQNHHEAIEFLEEQK